MENTGRASIPHWISKGHSVGILLSVHSSLPGSQRGSVQWAWADASWKIVLEGQFQGDAIYSQNTWTAGTSLQTDWGKWGVALAYSNHQFDGDVHYPELTPCLSWRWDAKGYSLATAAQWGSVAASPSRWNGGIQWNFDSPYAIVKPYLEFSIQDRFPYWEYSTGIISSLHNIQGILIWSPMSQRVELSTSWNSSHWTILLGWAFSTHGLWSSHLGGGWREL
jgi:hypothetical protein